MSDVADLIRRFHSGESAAFETIVSTHQDDIYTLCLRVLGTDTAAEAVAEGIFITAHQAMHRLNPETPIRPWLLQLAVNDLSDKSSEDDEASEAPHAQSAQLNGLLQGLDMPFRLAVILRDVIGIDATEVAEILQLPIGTARSRIHRGRLTMARSLSEHGEGY
jgi:RNA polymerase sigma-70 factor (ECF subfamily)